MRPEPDASEHAEPGLPDLGAEHAGRRVERPFSQTLDARAAAPVREAAIEPSSTAVQNAVPVSVADRYAGLPPEKKTSDASESRHEVGALGVLTGLSGTSSAVTPSSAIVCEAHGGPSGEDLLALGRRGGRQHEHASVAGAGTVQQRAIDLHGPRPELTRAEEPQDEPSRRRRRAPPDAAPHRAASRSRRRRRAWDRGRRPRCGSSRCRPATRTYRRARRSRSSPTVELASVISRSLSAYRYASRSTPSGSSGGTYRKQQIDRPTGVASSKSGRSSARAPRYRASAASCEIRRRYALRAVREQRYPHLQGPLAAATELRPVPASRPCPCRFTPCPAACRSPSPRTSPTRSADPRTTTHPPDSGV